MLGASGPLVRFFQAMTAPSRRRRSRGSWAAAGCGWSPGDRAGSRGPEPGWRGCRRRPSSGPGGGRPTSSRSWTGRLRTRPPGLRQGQAYDPGRTSLAGREQAKADELSRKAGLSRLRPSSTGGSGGRPRACPAWSTSGSSAGAARPGGPIPQSPRRWSRRSPRRPMSRRGRRRSSSGGPARSSQSEGRRARSHRGPRCSGCSPGCRRESTRPGRRRTRRGLAGRPQRKFSQACPAAPGELMEIDSTPLDVLVLLDDEVPAGWS